MLMCGLLVWCSQVARLPRFLSSMCCTLRTVQPPPPLVNGKPKPPFVALVGLILVAPATSTAHAGSWSSDGVSSKHWLSSTLGSVLLASVPASQQLALHCGLRQGQPCLARLHRAFVVLFWLRAEIGGAIAQLLLFDMRKAALKTKLHCTCAALGTFAAGTAPCANELQRKREAA